MSGAYFSRSSDFSSRRSSGAVVGERRSFQFSSPQVSDSPACDSPPPLRGVSEMKSVLAWGMPPSLRCTDRWVKTDPSRNSGRMQTSHHQEHQVASPLDGRWKVDRSRSPPQPVGRLQQILAELGFGKQVRRIIFCSLGSRFFFFSQSSDFPTT